MEDIPMNESGEGALLGLPESETDLDVCKMDVYYLFYSSNDCSRLITFPIFTFTEFN